MASSTYERDTSGPGIRYVLVSSNNKGMIGCGRTIVLLQILFCAVLGFTVIMLAAAGAARVNGLLALLLFALYFVGCFVWIRDLRQRLENKASTALGRGGRSVINLQSGTISADFTSAAGVASAIQISLDDVRRVKITNTLDTNFDIRSRDLGDPILAAGQPRSERTEVLLSSQGIGVTRTTKAKLTCFAVYLDYANASVALADDLDDVTAMKFFDDLTSDYAQMTQVVGPLRLVG